MNNQQNRSMKPTGSIKPTQAISTRNDRLDNPLEQLKPTTSSKPLTIFSSVSNNTSVSLSPSVEMILETDIPHISNQNLDQMLTDIDRTKILISDTPVETFTYDVKPYQVAVACIALVDLIKSANNAGRTGLIEPLKTYLLTRCDTIMEIFSKIQFMKEIPRDKANDKTDNGPITNTEVNRIFANIFKRVFPSLTVNLTVPNQLGMDVKSSMDAVPALNSANNATFTGLIEEKINSCRSTIKHSEKTKDFVEFGKQWVQYNMMLYLWIEPEGGSITYVDDIILAQNIESVDMTKIQQTFGNQTIRPPSMMESYDVSELLRNIQNDQDALISTLQKKLTTLKDYDVLSERNKTDIATGIERTIESVPNSINSSIDSTQIEEESGGGRRRRKTQKRLRKNPRVKSMKPKKRHHRRKSRTLRKKNQQGVTKKR